MTKFFTENEKWDRALRPDAQAFDEIRIVTVPRYKTSYMSGDEWRISAKIQFMRKGEILHEETYRNVDIAAQFLPYLIEKAKSDCMKTYYAGIYREDGVALCDQEGCPEPATVVYKKKEDICNRCASRKESKSYRLGKEKSLGRVRMFCDRHSTRGDCGLDDADDNYEPVEGKKESVPATDKKEASLISFSVSSPEEIPEKLSKAIKEYKK